ncbi:uncharacterized protein LACBIDRAFT_329822 [Laccaria bicolor S238N-H82]|uniref:Predicted protein n=1 Tax=Laccaria bicolor (strain S238N-H82 / ATCC MYA-4686) TaxID=486041 RepID=B0DJC0_LACBS|nr:uncharacterized protein LACBIDRAFT_329822 [Laccaria bicolor S238N-H82]EDR05378.1 predicted protein [Laccaria bicolor S238N-H82]|eukprot:XP_001883936.1 predicted protein [Laccaria bicolor S238N-H82]
MIWLNASLIRYSAEKRILPDTQVAAQPGVQTRDLMSYLSNVKCWANRNKQSVYALKRDQMKCFDYLSPEGFYDADPDALVISSSSMQKDDPHLKDARLSLRVAMVEATDDSYIFSRSLVSLQRNALAMERFQYAYGWLTQWAKLKAYVLSATGDHPDTVKFQSVSTGRGVNPLAITEHDVALIKDDLDFLRTKVNDPTSRFVELKDFIESFQFPKVIGRLPITLIRKIVSQNVVSRCRALLSLQSLKQPDAEALDRLIIQKVHDALGFPFQPSTSIATLPVLYHGFDFPSIARINAGISSVTGAATGGKSLVMKIPGRNISILHGEQVGLIIALVLAGDLVRNDLVKILTDHLNSVRLIVDSQTDVPQVPRPGYMNGRSYYRWILSLINRSRAVVSYTAGHSDPSTLEARMNGEADFLATSSQKIYAELPHAPIPSFFMNDFTIYSQTDGWIESNVMHFIDILMARKTATALGIGHDLRMSTWAHDPGPPPDFPYTKAVSAHSAAVQLYARSGQLATAEVLYKRGKRDNDLCCLGCDATGDMRHIFVHCKEYERWREDARRELMERTELKLVNMQTEEAVKTGLLVAANVGGCLIVTIVTRLRSHLNAKKCNVHSFFKFSSSLRLQSLQCRCSRTDLNGSSDWLTTWECKRSLCFLGAPIVDLTPLVIVHLFPLGLGVEPRGTLSERGGGIAIVQGPNLSILVFKRLNIVTQDPFYMNKTIFQRSDFERWRNG